MIWLFLSLRIKLTTDKLQSCDLHIFEIRDMSVEFSWDFPKFGRSVGFYFHLLTYFTFEWRPISFDVGPVIVPTSSLLLTLLVMTVLNKHNVWLLILLKCALVTVYLVFSMYLVFYRSSTAVVFTEDIKGGIQGYPIVKGWTHKLMAHCSRATSPGTTFSCMSHTADALGAPLPSLTATSIAFPVVYTLQNKSP